MSESVTSFCKSVPCEPTPFLSATAGKRSSPLSRTLVRTILGFRRTWSLLGFGCQTAPPCPTSSHTSPISFEAYLPLHVAYSSLPLASPISVRLVTNQPLLEARQRTTSCLHPSRSRKSSSHSASWSSQNGRTASSSCSSISGTTTSSAWATSLSARARTCACCSPALFPTDHGPLLSCLLFRHLLRTHAFVVVLLRCRVVWFIVCSSCNPAGTSSRNYLVPISTGCLRVGDWRSSLSNISCIRSWCVACSLASSLASFV